MKVGSVWREKRLRPPMYNPRDVGIVTAPENGVLRIQTVQLVMGVWFRQRRAYPRTITVEEFQQRFVAHETPR